MHTLLLPTTMRYDLGQLLHFRLFETHKALSTVADAHILQRNTILSFKYVSWYQICKVKVRSYYTAIALRSRYIDYFLPQVTAASTHFKLK